MNSVHLVFTIIVVVVAIPSSLMPSTLKFQSVWFLFWCFSNSDQLRVLPKWGGSERIKETTESGTVLGACLASSLECFLVLRLEFFGDAPTPPAAATLPGTCSDTRFLLDDVPWGAVWVPSLTPDFSRCCPTIFWINGISRFHSWTRLLVYFSWWGGWGIM